MNLPETEWSEEFENFAKNRVSVSYYKYGSAKINFGNHLVDALKSAEMCRQKYLETGNTEYLVDMRNYIMFEFMYPSLPNAIFKATDGNQSAGKHGMSINEMEQFKEESY